MVREEIADWLRLEQTPGVGNTMARKLLKEFGLPGNIFSASMSSLLLHVPQRIAKALHSPLNASTEELITRTCNWLAEEGNYLFSLADSEYPPNLLEIPDPPLLLYAKGRIDLLHANSLAMVGSRHASTQGFIDAERFAQALSQAGLSIISGLASGIDTAAHQGGLRASGSTVAVIGTGADIVYPAKNRSLAHQIATSGCILSEYPLGTPAIAANFPRRNRIISGLSRGVLVVEAALQSGSLITARCAAEQGREVFALPGSIHSPLAKGCHHLIKQGAKLVETAQDILEELHFATFAPPSHSATSKTETASVASASQQPLLNIMGFAPVAPDLLTQRSGLDAAGLADQLLELELNGLVERLPDGRYQRLQA